MLSTVIIVFREILEAALIIGILLVATRGLEKRGFWVSSGCVAGVLGALVVAFFTETISDALQGMGQEVFNASVLCLAAALISWHVVWMKCHAVSLTAEMKRVGKAVIQGQAPVHVLALVAFLAVLREGSEIVLFVYGIMVAGESTQAILSGGLIGLFLGAAVGFVIYRGLIKVPTGSLFSVTSAILILLAAGMVSQAAGFLTSAGILPALIDPAWDTSQVLSEQNILGKVLHTLVGYTARPSGVQVIGYIITVAGIVMLLKWFGKTPVKRQVTGQNGAGKLAAALLLVLSAGIIGLSQEAHATKKIYSPHVEQGELELEYRGGITFDDRATKDDKQKHKFAVGYGVTQQWFTEVYGELENHPGSGEDEGLEYSATEWENRFQISEPGEWWADTGFYLAYEFAAENEEADKLEMKLLLEKSIDQWTHRTNLTLEKEIGSDSEEEWEGGASWSTSYRLRPEFEPGVEIHWEYGDFAESRPFEEQEFLLGPVVYGKIGPNIKYDVGYLFGLSEDSPDGQLKWIFEFEWHF